MFPLVDCQGSRGFGFRSVGEMPGSIMVERFRVRGRLLPAVPDHVATHQYSDVEEGAEIFYNIWNEKGVFAARARVIKFVSSL